MSVYNHTKKIDGNSTMQNYVLLPSIQYSVL